MTPIEALRHMVAFMQPALRELCHEVIEDPLFQEAPGGKTRHHTYVGGLAEHTMDVLHNAQKMCSAKDALEIVTCAAVFHDYAKVYEYEANPMYTGEKLSEGQEYPKDYIVKLPYAEMIRHVAGSFHHWMTLSHGYELTEEFRLQVAHCILSHHGRKEWGSPIEPQTLEAHILHAADMMSMRQDSQGRTK
jgi:3'-5' exoribonuclease